MIPHKNISNATQCVGEGRVFRIEYISFMRTPSIDYLSNKKKTPAAFLFSNPPLPRPSPTPALWCM